MEIVAVLLLALAIPGAVALYHRSQRMARAWRLGARQLGLEYARVDGGLAETRLSGHWKGLQLSVSGAGGLRSGVARVSVWSARLPRGMQLRPEGLRTTVDKALGEAELTVGDPEFDAAVLVRGDAVDVAAVLSRHVRPLVLRALADGIRIEQGRVVREVDYGVGHPDTLLTAVSPVLELAKQLVGPESPAGRLAASVRRDPCPGVRLRCLELLLAHMPDCPETAEARRGALEDEAPEVRLTAARAAGTDGHACLVALAGDAAVDEAVAAAAAAAAGPALAVGEAIRIVRGARSAHRKAVAEPAVVALGRIGGVAACECLRDIVANGWDHEVGAAAAALVAAGDTGAERALVTALGRRTFEPREAAARALGALGSSAAVAPLHAAVTTHPLDIALRRAASAAVVAIQERLTGASPGQVSLADGESGTLQLSAAPAGSGGEVSLGPEPRHAGRRREPA